MNVIVTLEHRFDRTPDGRVWTQSPFSYPFWTRYLKVFEQVRVVARICDRDTITDQWRQANGEGVTFVPIPYYLGPWQYLQKVQQIRRAIQATVAPEDAVILRVSSQLADVLVPQLQSAGHPYGVEVVGDPYDVFAPGSIDHPLRRFFRWWFPRKLRQQCGGACAAAYVTEFALQRRYPPASGAFATHYSSVELPEEAFVESPRVFGEQARHELVFVGTLSQLYKAPDVLIRAVAACVAQGLDLHLSMVGDGQFQASLEALVRELGMCDRITFRGRLPAGAAVREVLDQADVFILASHQEGLPRAMIEAMARGLPCIGSTVGGIPELLQDQDMVPPGEVQALATQIKTLVTDPARLTTLSQQNLTKAQAYRNAELERRRTDFYRAVRTATTHWIAAK